MAAKTKTKQEIATELSENKVIYTARKGDLEEFLAMGGTAACGENKWSELINDAVYFENLDILEHFIKEGPEDGKVYSKPALTENLLKYAVLSGAMKSVKFLLDYGKKIMPLDMFDDMLFNIFGDIVRGMRRESYGNMLHITKIFNIFSEYGFDINKIKIIEGIPRSILFDAAKSGNYNIMCAVMDYPEFNIKCAIGYDGGYSIIRNILVGGWQPDYQDIKIKLIKRILEEKDVLDLKKCSPDNPSLIQYALEFNFSKFSSFYLIKLLLDAGVPLEKDNREKGSAMNAIARSGNDALKKYIEEYSNVNCAVKLTASQQRMFNAVRDGDIVALRNELAKGVNPNTIKNPFVSGVTALHVAVLRHLNKDIVQELLNAGADPNIKDITGNTPINIIGGTGPGYYNSQYNGIKKTDIYNTTDFLKVKNCIGLLISAGSEDPADIAQMIRNLYDQRKSDSIQLKELQLKDIFIMTRDAGYKLDIQDLFLQCVRYGFSVLTEEMIKSGADINKKIDLEYNHSYNIALTIGGQSKHIEICGCTPVFSAATKGYVNIIGLLVDHGANPFIKEREGLSAAEIFKIRHPESADLFDDIILKKIKKETLANEDSVMAETVSVDFNI